MAIIDLPALPGFSAARFSLNLDVTESGYRGFYTGNSQRMSTLSDRLSGLLTLPGTTDRATAAMREALVMQLRSSGDYLRMGLPHRARKVGSLSGSPIVAANVLSGARSVSLSNTRAGENLIHAADALSYYLAPGWTTSNATVTPNAAVAQDGSSTAWQLTRTATGNHFTYQIVPMANTTNRTVTFSVWIKSGTLTGNVVLRIRDGADAEIASSSITPTSTWTLYRLAGTFGSSSAANVRLYIDPANDVGAVGDTLLVWYSEFRALTGLDGLCTATADGSAGPSGLQGAAETVTRTGAGNAFSKWTFATTSHVSKTFTFSAWLLAGTFSGSVVLRIRDGADAADLASQSVSLTGAWQRVSVTATFGAAPAANIIVYLDQTDGGSIGETYFRYGVMLERGSAPTEFYPWPTAASGDVISVGGNLLQIGYPGAAGDFAGAITLPLTLPAPKAITAGAVATTESPTGLWEWDGDAPQLDYSPGSIQAPIVIPVRQVIA